MRGTRWLGIAVAVTVTVLVACSGTSAPVDDAQPSAIEATPVTMIDPRDEVRWPAAEGPSDDDLRRIAEAFGDDDRDILLPATGDWPDGATVSVSLYGYIPDTDETEADVTVYDGSHPLLTVSRTVRSCADQLEPGWRPRKVRSRPGCVNRGGVSFAVWREARHTWHAESGSYRPRRLVLRLEPWVLWTEDDY